MNGKTYRSDLTGLLFGWRLATNMIESHKRGAETYARNPGMYWLAESERFAREKAEKAERLYSEFWQLVEQAGSVFVDKNGYLYS